MTDEFVAVGRVGATKIYAAATVLRSTYPFGGAICLVSSPGTEDQQTYSVNLPDDPLPPNHCWLKGWSEGEGSPQALEDAGIVKLTGRRAKTGFVEAEEAELLR